ncbi:DUF805 domain-containing protein [Pokkaliibacter sp. CJK22405]|uniref:DUF805 domain-containing protein n=1 Tax=Pokkaliibacter sp. CJK22405 TaxID=3384615 RepID=UPI003984C746
MEWYLSGWRQYANFSGRARRQEYWMFTLINLIAFFVCGVIDSILTMGLLSMVYGLAVILPGLAMIVRRLHDTGRSGWWFLVSFIPAIGGIILFIFLVLDSQPGANEYGENPKGVKAVLADGAVI